MLRTGRFRHRLLDDSFLEQKSSACISCLEPFLNLWRKQQLDDTEIAAVYILIFSFFRRPKDFLGGLHNLVAVSSATNSVSSNKVIELLDSVLPTELKNAKSLKRLASHDPFVNHFCSMSWRSIPISAAKSLCAWKAGKYKLKLLTSIPSPEEVLIMQSQGQRCVSMLILPEQIRTFVDEGRDVLGFIIHDLIHADHFFADQIKAQAQIQFCQKLLVILDNSEIQNMLSSDSEFKKEFHYLMSDMNSVPLHLLKTLKAVLLGHFKRRNKLSMVDALPYAEEQSFNHLFEIVLKPWNFSEDALNSARRLNTKQYNGHKDNELLHLALT